MIPFRFALGAAFVAVSTTMAAADCAEHLALMDEVLDQASRESIAASSGGQGVAGAREARAMTGTDAPGDDGTATDMPPDEPQPTQAPGHAPVAEAGDRVQTLRAKVDEARALAGQDEAACRETLVTGLRELLSGEEEQPGS